MSDSVINYCEHLPRMHLTNAPDRQVAWRGKPRPCTLLAGEHVSGRPLKPASRQAPAQNAGDRHRVVSASVM